MEDTRKRHREENFDDQYLPKKRHFGDNGTIDDEGKLENYIKNQKTIAILKRKGVRSLFPVQFKTYDIIAKGKDLIARDKTGSGKTLAFALPIIERLRLDKCFQKDHLAKFLVVLPTRELALQVKEEIQSLRFRDEADFRVIAVYGKSDIKYQIDTIKKGIDIIVGTPGRLIDLLERDVIKMNQLQVLCLDEADEMLKQGFKEDIEKIYRYIEKNAPKKTQNLLFSATIPPWLKEISQTYQDKDCDFVNLIKEESLSTPQTLTHMFIKLSSSEEIQRPKIINNLLKKFANKSGNSIIFCERKADVQRLASSLKDDYNIKNEPLHSDVPQFKREKAYKCYKSGQLKCLVATNVAARGLDFPEIDVVIQTEPPNNVEPYIHRSGRTARKGREGISITLCNDKNERLINNIERQARIKMVKLYSKDYMGKGSQKGDNDKERHRKYSEDEEEELQVYAKYLPSQKSQKDIKEFFQDKNIAFRNIKLLKSKEGEFKGCAFLKFSSRSQRDKCLDLDGATFDGQKISLSIPKPK